MYCVHNACHIYDACISLSIFSNTWTATRCYYVSHINYIISIFIARILQIINFVWVFSRSRWLHLEERRGKAKEEKFLTRRRRCCYRYLSRISARAYKYNLYACASSRYYTLYALREIACNYVGLCTLGAFDSFSFSPSPPFLSYSLTHTEPLTRHPVLSYERV